MPHEEDIGVLAVPAQPGAYGGLAVDETVVVHENRGAVPIRLETPGDSTEGLAEGLVVVTPGVAGDATGGPRGRGGGRSPIRAGSDDERPGTRQDRGRIGGPFGVAVREVHATVKTGGLAFDEMAARVEKGFGARDADGVEAGGKASGAHVLPERAHCSILPARRAPVLSDAQRTLALLAAVALG